MSKKCWIVSVELEVMAFAETAEEAKRLAVEEMRQEGGTLHDDDFRASPATYMPCDYESDSCVAHGGKGDVTAAEALAQTPEYLAAHARWAKDVGHARDELERMANHGPTPEAGKAAVP